jgi:hypothetical protein
MEGMASALVAALLESGVPLHFMVEDVWLCSTWRHDPLAIIAEAAVALRTPIPPAIRTLCGEGLRPLNPDKAGVTFVSQALRHHYTRQGFSVPHAQVRLGGLNVVSTVPACRPPPPFEVVAVGQLTAERGFEDLIHALENCATAAPSPKPIRVRIIGDGSPAYRAHLAGRGRAAAGVSLAFEFTGRLPAAEVRAALSQAHLFVHPSRLPEGLPRVIVEALAAGVPVVASDSGGQRDVLGDGRWGRLYPAGDVHALAAAIAGVLDDWTTAPEQLRERVLAAQAYAVRAFDFDHYVDGHLQELEAVSRTERGAPRPSLLRSLAPEIDEFTAQLTTSALRAAHEIESFESDAVFHVATVLKRAGCTSHAVRAFMHLNERGGDAPRRRASFHLGELEMLHGRWPAAQRWLEECLVLAPDHQKASYALEYARAEALPPHLAPLAVSPQRRSVPRIRDFVPH